MATPSDLVAHYSSQAFRTRISALTFAGAVMAVVIKWKEAGVETNLIGLALVAVVGSLGELNRRYTHSYLAACLASALEVPRNSDEVTTAIRWKLFSALNEWQWAARSGSIFRLSPWRVAANRFLLNWLTYLPGLMVGVLIIFRGKISALGWCGLLLAAGFILHWLNQSLHELDPEKFKQVVTKILSSDADVQAILSAEARG